MYRLEWRDFALRAWSGAGWAKGVGWKGVELAVEKWVGAGRARGVWGVAVMRVVGDLWPQVARVAQIVVEKLSRNPGA